MRAMILAAGLGTRLRPLTDHRPKALVEIDGRTLLEITLRRLRSVGISEVIVNAHHFADAIADYLGLHDFGMRVELSREQELLDTGGGLKKAAWFFLEQGTDEPFLVHNVDVLSSINLPRLLEFHRERCPLATLAVQGREGSRQLLFDDGLQLYGRTTGAGDAEIARPATGTQTLAFCGIHVISRHIFELMSEQGAFSIVDLYLRLAKQGERILAFRADESYWRDLGTPEKLRDAALDIQQGHVSI